MSHYRFSFPSTLEQCSHLRHCIGVVARIEGYRDGFISELELTIHEVFVNAVRHGNQDNQSLSVILTLEAGELHGERFLEARIRDCGEGFEPGRAITAICSNRIYPAPGGRGLLIVSSLAESFMIGKAAGGCVVVLRYIPY